MTEQTREKMVKWLEKNSDERLDICKCINSYDGSMDWADVYDLDELAGITDAYGLAQSIIYGDVTNMEDNVRYDGYGNLENVTDYELAEESEDCIDEIIDFIEENGFSELYSSTNGLEEIYNSDDGEDEPLID